MTASANSKEPNYTGTIGHCVRYIGRSEQDWQQYLFDEKLAGIGSFAVPYRIAIKAKPQLIAKIYRTKHLPVVRSNPLAIKQLQTLTANEQALTKSLPFVAWPRRMIFTKHCPTPSAPDYKSSFIGFTMRFLHNTVSLYDFVSKKSQRLDVTPRDTANVARLIARQVHMLHDHQWKFRIIDMSATNIRVSNDYSEVYFIDADSFQFLTTETRTHFVTKGLTPGFKAPWSDKEIAAGRALTNTHDDFVLAIHIFQMLVADHTPYPFHPFKFDRLTEDELIAKKIFPLDYRKDYEPNAAQQAIYQKVPAKLRAMFSRAFTNGKPPAALEWADALDAYWGSLPAGGT